MAASGGVLYAGNGTDQRPEAARRLVPPMPDKPVWGWLGAVVVALFGAVLRFVALDRPWAVMFDETYYAKEGYSLLRYGVARKTLGTAEDPIADRRLIAGNTDIFVQCAPEHTADCADYVVHPPLGKWMIAAGEWLFGVTPFGWRFAAALAGTLSILILVRVTRRMTRSTLLGCLAGFLLALDGLHFVLSRSALLDIFLTFWVLAAFACLIADRDRTRLRLGRRVRPDGPDTGPTIGPRPWLILAGLCLGAAVATKWSGGYFLIAFAVLVLIWDAGARRALAVRRPYVGAVTRGGLGLVAALGLLPAAVYLLSWTGWFASDGGWGRDWDRATAQGPVHFVVDSIRSLAAYHREALAFHTGLSSPHDYESQPWSWPFLLRPVPFFYESKRTCGVESCSQEVLGVGTPVIWYAGILALIVMIAWFAATRDWRAGTVLLAYAAGIGPWVYFAIADQRTMFIFYALPSLPFMIIALALTAGLMIGRVSLTTRRLFGASAVGAFALLAVINFWWLYPVFSAESIPYQDWYNRMLYRSWYDVGAKQ
ncbi:phospholipid carrier-dependent glycosyltransferase [Thermopolyspora sp. NPDC052614]|uniref:dolichyl-phosphate-mannose--protein mannosyltransferase n=1 Tax=Thermopolyspora sp. NPDC052614 TaxID=3155682 RepID=UPI003416D736